MSQAERDAIVALVRDADESRVEAEEMVCVRDQLLPQLMSGRIVVDEAWEAVPS
jgi:hypothetical protein